MPIEPLTPLEERELSRLFSALIALIHVLPHEDTQVLMAIDERIRGDTLTKADLESVREIAKRQGRR